MWIKITDKGVSYVNWCPFDYCKTLHKKIDNKNPPDSQCAFNRAGRLCGGCEEGYSLAIGSSHCIHCPNNNNLALLIFFAAAGFLLVFFISAFNLTVTQGLINGLIFYANIVWMNRNVILPHSDINIVLRAFLAWLNLDFGIECCFFSRSECILENMVTVCISFLHCWSLHCWCATLIKVIRAIWQ